MVVFESIKQHIYIIYIMKSTLLQIQELRRKKYIFEEHSTQGLDLPRGFHFVEDQEKISKAGCSGWGRFIPPTYRWSNERPGTSPFRPGTARHGLINGLCRACPWAELPAQARPESALIVSSRPVWPDSPAARKCFNKV